MNVRRVPSIAPRSHCVIARSGGQGGAFAGSLASPRRWATSARAVDPRGRVDRQAVADRCAVAPLEVEDVGAGERGTFEIELRARELAAFAQRGVERAGLHDLGAGIGPRGALDEHHALAGRGRPRAEGDEQGAVVDHERGLEIELLTLVAARVVEQTDAVGGGERYVSHGDGAIGVADALEDRDEARVVLDDRELLRAEPRQRGARTHVRRAIEAALPPCS